MRIAFNASTLALGIASICALVGLVDPAAAYLNAPAEPAPGPLIGLGLPAAGAVIGALSVLRYLRQR
jgi:hypothetical protein